MKYHNRYTSRVLLTTTLLLATAGLSMAGPLSPAAGPVVSTMKPLSDVEPRIAINSTNTPGDANSVYRITQPGSYYLTDNVDGVWGKKGIEIEAADVTLDLNGFALIGTSGATAGIASGFNASRVSIRNGSVRNWPSVGIDLLNTESARVEHVSVSGSTSMGVRTGDHSMVDSCTSNENGTVGFVIGNASLISNSLATGNDQAFELGGSTRAVRCTATLSKHDGFQTQAGAVVENCIVLGNSGNGIMCSPSTRVVDTTIQSNAVGVVFASYCTILNNTIDANAGAGIQGPAGAVRSVVKGNNCTRNTLGIDVDGATNLILGNTCSLNTTNFVIAANNRVASILALPLSGAINGNSGGTSISDTDANYAY